MQNFTAAAPNGRAFATVTVDERHRVEVLQAAVENMKSLCWKLSGRAREFKLRAEGGMTSSWGQ